MCIVSGATTSRAEWIIIVMHVPTTGILRAFIPIYIVMYESVFISYVRAYI